MTLTLPEQATRLIFALEAAGFEAWAVGGWVRDALLGLPDHDIDVCTSAHWEQVAEVCADKGWETHETGVKHGTLTCVVCGLVIEVTTYRTEGTYSDFRRPDSVEFVTSVADDLARRDFTINAIAFHPERGLFDPFDGAGDLERQLIRCVGDPRERLAEDALRVLRAVRFACRFGFDIEPATHDALVEFAPQLKHIACERIGAELDGILATGRGAWALRRETDVLCAAIPQLSPMVGFDQRSPYHAFDVLEHTVRVMETVEEFTCELALPELRWAALLHDVAKPTCFNLDPDGRGHFFGHPGTGAEMADIIMRRMALPLETIRATCLLIRLHDRMIHPNTRSVRRALTYIDARLPEADPHLPSRTWPFMHELLILKRADALGKKLEFADYALELDKVESVVRVERRLHQALRISDLAIGGTDVMRELSLDPGPRVGEVLKATLAAVLDGEVANTRDDLLTWISRYAD